MADFVALPASLVRTLVAEIARGLRERYGEALREIRLFGSYAKGEAGEESDVDEAGAREEIEAARGLVERIRRELA